MKRLRPVAAAHPQEKGVFMSHRESPLDMGLEPGHVEHRNGWTIALTYRGEKTRSPLFVADLSPVPKWTLQGEKSELATFAGVNVPPAPGDGTLEQGILTIRLSFGECRIMALGDETLFFTDSFYTDVTDAFAAFAVVGPAALDLLSKLSPVDLEGHGPPLALAAQAPVEDVSCLLVRIDQRDRGTGLIVSCPRGYGQFLLEAFLDAGREYRLAVAGWERFSKWMKT